ncbi:MAG: metallophosphoesterase [Chloroflexi bacterium]|nr:metallophosphoesterase [Chloroflexota bacterium]
MSFKLFFTTDVHGSDRCFRKFINAAKFYDAQVLVLGGDITGKAVVPVVHARGNVYTTSFTGHPREVEADQLEPLLNEIRFNGFYPYVTNPDELDSIEAQPGGTADLFRKAIAESLKGWIALAEERLRPLNVKVYISPGNDDDFIVDETLNGSDFVINPEEKVLEIAPGVSMLTFGYSNPTPWNSPRELPESELAGRLNSLAVQIPGGDFSIYNIHVPPKDTPIDQAAQLDASLKPIVSGGRVLMTGVGSTAVRDLIMKYQPDLALHGHVHEAPGVIRLGKTVCINPGSEYSDGVLRGALVVIDEKKKKFSYQLTMG